ncbi:4a-hydroxytetrahydrobiopterin dehydratase [Pseudogemmobacter humi]|uniref:Putative pterin-4-alpha-carbinolamine dehydratase n=1 Tax=Pseudogemmobacter humi TaxID=2483812 RepID=A0A3P5WRK1_9RHOB|nr:Putative pterin-4-alpha-carbinolamine dehydratase [Pseudogemmobacter humi]
MAATLLSEDERKSRLPELESTGWRAAEGQDAIRKIWKFRNFPEAFAFMARAALAAEKADHHPDWSNRYNIVDVTLTTHSARGLTALDLALATKLDKFAPGAEVIRDHGADIRCLCEIRAEKP